MKKISVIAITLISLFIFAACGSMVAYKKGDNTKGYLQGVKKIGVSFDYTKTAVGNMTQEAYIAKKEADGKADFRAKWETQKTTVFIPKFELLINEYTKEKGIVVGTKIEDADLNMVIHVTHIEPGWNIGISRRNATINLDIEIFKKGETEPVVVYGMTNVPGYGAAGFDFDAGFRIGQCFAKAGKEIGAFFSKD